MTSECGVYVWSGVVCGGGGESYDIRYKKVTNIPNKNSGEEE